MGRRRRPLFSPAWAQLLLLAVALVLLAARPAHLPVAPSRPGLQVIGPRSPADLIDRLRACEVPVRVVPAALSNPDLACGAYLCDRDRSWDELVAACRYSPDAKWKGVVQIKRFLSGRYPGGNPAIGPPSGEQVGGVVLFGDPELLRQIRQALRE